MQLVSRRAERGDTIIEVLFAFAVFALVAIGSLTIMNQGTSAAMRSLEITLVRGQMDAQISAINYIHKAYVAAYQKGSTPAPGTTAAQWVLMTNKVTGKGADNPSEFGRTNGGTRCPTMSSIAKPFILNARTARINGTPPSMEPPSGSVPPFAQVAYDASSNVTMAYGIWVEAVPSTAATSTSNVGYVDFHVRACWSTSGTDVPMTLGTIVRLYEPRG